MTGAAAGGATSIRDRLRILLGFARPARAKLVLSVLLAVAATVLELAPFLVIYWAVDELVSGTATAGGLQTLALFAVAAVAGRSVLWGSALAISHLAAFEAQYEVRLRLAEHLTRLPLGWFAARRSGEIKKAMADDVERMELLLAHAIPELVSAAVGWLFVTVWLLVLDWRMALATAAVLPFAYVFMRIALRNMAGRVAVTDAAASRMNGSIVELLHGLPVLKVFNQAEQALGATQTAIDDYADNATAGVRLFYPFGTAYQTVVVANIVVVVPVGLLLLGSGQVSVETLLLFFTVALGYSLPLLRLYKLGLNLTFMSSAAVLIQAILDTPPLPDTARRVELRGHSVELRGVSFGYHDHDVLHDISFTAAQGEVTALVGPSGAGKTTVARLIPRFWDVSSGTVSVGGVEVRSMAMEQLMETVAFVFQEPYLFNDTIGANIAMGRPSAPADEVAAAARAASAHEFIARLPAGYETVVGERGANLSVGEKQRITIARALLKDAPVVVLDEATAFADPENEAAIQEAIGALAAGRTLVVIAHRLSTVVGADRIVVLDRGTVVEQGRHAELLARDGLYHRLWRDQEAARDAAPVGARSVVESREHEGRGPEDGVLG